LALAVKDGQASLLFPSSYFARLPLSLGSQPPVDRERERGSLATVGAAVAPTIRSHPTVSSVFGEEELDQ